ncbi:hypothetical protein BH11PLA1_BH11PLA1_14630 [soil metagenome]
MNTDFKKQDGMDEGATGVRGAALEADTHLLEEDVRALSQRLDALALLDAAGSGLNAEARERIAARAAEASRRPAFAAVAPDAPAPLRLVSMERRVASHQLRRVLAPVRVAAAVLLTATAGLLTYSAISTGPSGPGTRTSGEGAAARVAVDAAREVESMESTISMFEGARTDWTSVMQDADNLRESIRGEIVPLPEGAGS